MTLNGAITQLVLLSEHPMMPVIFRPAIQKVIETISELEAQPEQTNCDYCHEDVDGYVKPIEKNGHAFVRFGMNGWELELKAKGWHGEAKIQHCPMCGRKLKNDK